MGDFGDAERRILALMRVGTEFSFQGQKYSIILSGKPTCHKGEPKTDIYILAKSLFNQVEIKISYKKENADFIENKMSAERAEQLLGSDWAKIIEQSTSAIRDQFEKRMLIYKNKFKRTEKGAITLGWKFELLNKNNGDLSGKMLLTEEQVIDKMIPITDYVKRHPDIYFVCKALNYRTFANKWDGDRPLSVQVFWNAEEKRLVPKLVYDKPLTIKGNEVAGRLQQYMKLLNIKTTDDIDSDNAGTDRII